MASGFYLKNAFRNIWNGKRQSVIYFLGIFISITVITSLSIWSVTAEDSSIRDFMAAQDYELRIRSYLPDRLPDIKDWLDQDSLVESSSFIFYNLAFFNAEDKIPFYRFYPLDNQENMSNPVGLSTLLLIDNKTIPRIASQFTFQGDFDIQEGEVLISSTIAQQLQWVYNTTITPGMKVNLSVCKQSTDYGVFLFQYEPEHFYNVTIRGIYDMIPGITMMQSSFSSDFLDSSVIFLQDNMEAEHIERMESNGLMPLLFAKLDPEQVTAEGADEIMPIIENLIQRLEIAQTTSLPYILDTPLNDLEQAFSKAKSYMFVLLPVIILGLIQSLFTTNIVVENRKTEIIILKERGGQKLQIIGSLLLEFLILALMGILFSVVASIIFAAIIPGLASEGLSWINFTNFLSNLKVQLLPIIVTILGILLISLIYASIRINQLLNIEISERELKFREKVQKGILLGSLIAITIGATAVLITLAIIYQIDLVDVYNYSLEETQKGTILFILITIIYLLLSVCFTLLFIYLLGKIKWNKILNKNGFFISNIFKKSNFKFNTIILILLIVTSTYFFTLTQLKTLKTNEEATIYYNNGSDLRIHTYDVHHSFAENFSQITGVEDVIPIMKSSGQYGFDSITLFGINATKYSDIGRWDDSSFDSELEIIPEIYKDLNYKQWLTRLPLEPNGTIISDSLAKKYELQIGETISLSNVLFGGTFGIDVFLITGIMHSAPGLGLTEGANLALGQPNDYYMLINEWKFFDNYRINNTNLFLAKTESTVSVDEIENEISQFEIVEEVNPDLVYISFGEIYVNRYVPPIRIFMYTQMILVLIIAAIIIISNIDFVLMQRRSNNAILFAIGNSWKNLLKMTMSELLILNLFAILFGAIIGFPMVVLSNFLTKSFLLDRLILPLQYSVNYIGILAVCLGIIIVPLLSILPTLLKNRNERIANVIFQLHIN